MQGLRPQPRLHAQDWRVPNLLPRIGQPGPIAGCQEIELVVSSRSGTVPDTASEGNIA